MVPANKKRAAMHSLYSLDINTRQRARNQPRLHRQLLPNDTDTHTQPLIVIKQKKETEAGREKEKERRKRAKRERWKRRRQRREKERKKRERAKDGGERGAQAAARRAAAASSFMRPSARAASCGRMWSALRVSPSSSLSLSFAHSLFLEDAAKYCIAG